MKAEELRIWNIVDYHGNEVTINSINDTDVGFSDYIPIDYPLLDEIKPIPLTEEWLVRFGFERNGNEFTTDWFLGISFDVIENDFHVYEVRDSFHITTIKHVHQLQNLYFTLTGNELNYEKATQN